MFKVCSNYLAFTIKIKRILVVLLNWKVIFKLFNPEMGQNGCMYLQQF